MRKLKRDSIIQESDNEDPASTSESGQEEVEGDDANTIVPKVRDNLNNLKESHLHQHRQVRCCSESLLLQSREVYSRANVLLDAHFELDREFAGGIARWTCVQRALTAIDNPQFLKHGDIKIYTKLNKDSPIVPHYAQYWSASIRRFKQRIADLCDKLSQTKRLRQFGSRLDATNRKAFNVIVQIWRKSLRGEEFTEPLSPCQSLLTSTETSLLLRQNETAVMSLCIRGSNQGTLEVVEACKILEWQRQWVKLDICADRSSDARALLHFVLNRYNGFCHINITTHIVTEFQKAQECVGLSPLLLCSDSINHVRCDAREMDICDVFYSSDYKQVIKMLLRTGQSKSMFNQPPRLSSLGLLSSAVIKHEGINTSSLPSHLRRWVETVARCTSCERFMAQQVAKVRGKESASRFKIQVTKAGFKVQAPIVEAVTTSLNRDSAYLPPLCETFKLVDLASNSTSTVNIGGSTSTPSLMANEKAFNWQFCSFCAALHYGIIASAVCCKCIMCTREREESEWQRKGIAYTPSQWHRIPLSQQG